MIKNSRLYTYVMFTIIAFHINKLKRNRNMRFYNVSTHTPQRPKIKVMSFAKESKSVSAGCTLQKGGTSLPPKVRN